MTTSQAWYRVLAVQEGDPKLTQSLVTSCVHNAQPHWERVRQGHGNKTIKIKTSKIDRKVKQRKKGVPQHPSVTGFAGPTSSH